jgi:hypothetical protein
LYVDDELDLTFRCRVVGGSLRLSPEARRAEYRPLDALGDLLPNQRVMFRRLVARGVLDARIAPVARIPPPVEVAPSQR